jgi:phage terminase small subunit
MSLTEKQQAFVREDAADPTISKAEAVRRAGYAAGRAKITASELSKDPEIQAEIERRLKKIAIATRVPLSAESVLIDLDDIDETCKRAGAGAWQVATRVKIAELKGKYLKMFTDRVEVGVDDALIEKLLEGRKRAGIDSPKVIDAQPVLELPAENENGQ